MMHFSAQTVRLRGHRTLLHLALLHRANKPQLQLPFLQQRRVHRTAKQTRPDRPDPTHSIHAKRVNFTKNKPMNVDALTLGQFASFPGAGR